MYGFRWEGRDTKFSELTHSEKEGLFLRKRTCNIKCERGIYRRNRSFHWSGLKTLVSGLRVEKEEFLVRIITNKKNNLYDISQSVKMSFRKKVRIV